MRRAEAVVRQRHHGDPELGSLGRLAEWGSATLPPPTRFYRKGNIMRTLKSKVTGQVVGDTCGLRKDGSVAVLFDDGTIVWYTAGEFAASFLEV